MTDKFRTYKAYAGDQIYADAFKPAANSANIFTQPTRALYVGTTGNVEILTAGVSNAVILFQAVPAGTLLPVRAAAVMANTTSSVIGLY